MAMSLKKKIKSGKTVLGTMLGMVTNPNIVYILKASGFDYIFVDCEHGTFTFQDVSNLAGLCRALDMGIIVRVPQADRQSIQKFSDMGIDGIMLPYVEETEFVERASQYARYKPYGTRGVSLAATVDFKGADNLPAVLQDINDSFIIIAQIESRKGVENIDKIMSIPGCDAVFFGVFDMSVSYDKPGEVNDPMFKDIIASVLDSARQHGKILGYHAFGEDKARWALEHGAQLLCWNLETTQLLETFKKDVAMINELPGFVK